MHLFYQIPSLFRPFLCLRMCITMEFQSSVNSLLSTRIYQNNYLWMLGVKTGNQVKDGLSSLIPSLLRPYWCYVVFCATHKISDFGPIYMVQLCCMHMLEPCLRYDSSSFTWSNKLFVLYACCKHGISVSCDKVVLFKFALKIFKIFLWLVYSSLPIIIIIIIIVTLLMCQPDLALLLIGDT